MPTMNAKLCVIGAGAWGENHVRTLDALGALGGVMDLDPGRLRVISEKYDTETFSTLDAAIARRFDGYVVSTSAETHYEIGRTILDAGLPCLIEKPMTMSVPESEALTALAEEKRVTLMAAHVLLFHPAINKMRELIEQGVVGDLYYLYSTRLKFGVVRTKENVFESFAVHDLALLDYLVGCGAERIQVHTGYFLQKDIVDYALAELEYPGNIKAHIHVSWLHPFKEQRVVVVGSKGMLWFDDARDRQVHYCDKHVEWEDGRPLTMETESTVIPYDASERPLERELKYFISHLKTPPEISSGQAGLDVVRTMETVLAEERHG